MNAGHCITYIFVQPDSQGTKPKDTQRYKTEAKQLHFAEAETNECFGFLLD